jgi:hypothetical protein
MSDFPCKPAGNTAPTSTHSFKDVKEINHFSKIAWQGADHDGVVDVGHPLY